MGSSDLQGLGQIQLISFSQTQEKPENPMSSGDKEGLLAAEDIQWIVPGTPSRTLRCQRHKQAAHE